MTKRTGKPVKEFSPGGILEASEAPPSRFQESENDPDFWKAYFRFPKHDLAESVLALRRLRGLTQSELAVMVGTQQPAIARIEAARANVGLDTIRALSSALDAVVHIGMHPAEDCAAHFLFARRGLRIQATSQVKTIAVDPCPIRFIAAGDESALSSTAEKPSAVSLENFALSA